MKRLYKLTAIILVVIIVLISACIHLSAATIFKQDGFLYSYTGASKADLYGREVYDEDLVIPKEFNNHYITNIVDSAFINDSNITSLNLSNATLLERIGYYAFSNCSNLAGTVYFSGRISTIGDSAFEGCSSLQSVRYMNNLVTVIKAQTFYNCSSLGVAVLPDSLVTIEKFAFANCYALEEVTIPKSVSSIDATAFDGDENLTIKCYYESYAHQFAEENGIDYAIIDTWNIPTEPETDEPTEPETEEPTVPETEPQTTPETEQETYAPITSYRLGDADGDNKISVLDATTIQKCLASLIVDKTGRIHLAGSIDGDNLNVMHATFIQKYLAQIPVNYPIGKLIEQNG